jgi:hypothetical protein
MCLARTGGCEGEARDGVDRQTRMMTENGTGLSLVGIPFSNRVFREFITQIYLVVYYIVH